MNSIGHRAIKYVNTGMSAAYWALAEGLHYCAHKATAASMRHWARAVR